MNGLLPPPPQPNVQFSVLVQSAEISPIGLGGYVGLHEAPEGDIVGRRISAEVGVVIRVPNVNVQEESVNVVLAAFLGADPISLRQNGILQLHYGRFEPHLQSAVLQTLIFKVVFEHLLLPSEAGDIIQEIPINLDVDGNPII